MSLFALVLAFQLILNIIPATSWNIVEEPLQYFDLSQISLKSSLIYNYTSNLPDQYKFLKKDSSERCLILGARNRLVTFSIGQNKNQIQTIEYQVPYIDANFSEYVISIIPTGDLEKNQNKILVCMTSFVCIQARFEEETCSFLDFNGSSTSPAPQFINDMSLESVVYYTNTSNDSNNQVLYSAAMYRGGQYISRYNSGEGLLHKSQASKHVGQALGTSKEFIKFLESNEKIFLFQYMNRKIPDPLEKSRDVTESASLVSQICKNDQGIGEFNEFFSELKAQINCFKDSTPISGNSANFRFEILKVISDFIHFKKRNTNMKLFYGVFNTPKEHPTGTAICFFDIQDIENIFRLENFDYEKGELIRNYKFDDINVQNCPKLTNDEKAIYRRITSELRIMKNGIYPVRRRKASFITLYRYRITALVVVENNIKSKESSRFKNMNLIYAGTDNGRILRIAHYFTDEYFENELADEEQVKLLDEIQLFNTTAIVTKIDIIRAVDGRVKRVLAITRNEVKALQYGMDICNLFSVSCKVCVEQNILTDNKCKWVNKTCMSVHETNTNLTISAKTLYECQRLDVKTTLAITETTKTNKFKSPAIRSTVSINNLTFLNLEIATSTFSKFNKKNSTAVEDGSFLRHSNENLTVFLIVAGLVIAMIVGICTGYVLRATNFCRNISFQEIKSKSCLSKQRECKMNFYQDQKQLAINTELNSKVFGPSSLHYLNRNHEEESVVVNNSISNEISYKENENCVNYFKAKPISVEKKLENFTFQNDFNLKPNIQQSLPPEYFKIVNLMNLELANNPNRHVKNRLSSGSSADSSPCLYNLQNYSQTCLVKQKNSFHNNNDQSSLQPISTISNPVNLNYTHTGFVLIDSKRSHNSMYKKNPCTEVDNHLLACNNTDQNSSCTNNQINSQKCCSIISPDLSYMSDTFSINSSPKIMNNQIENPYIMNKTVLIEKNTTNGFHDRILDNPVNNSFANQNDIIEDFFMNNSYV